MTFQFCPHQKLILQGEANANEVNREKSNLAAICAASNLKFYFRLTQCETRKYHSLATAKSHQIAQKLCLTKSGPESRCTFLLKSIQSF